MCSLPALRYKVKGHRVIPNVRDLLEDGEFEVELIQCLPIDLYRYASVSCKSVHKKTIYTCCANGFFKATGREECV